MLQVSSLPEDSMGDRRHAVEGGSGAGSDGFKDERGVVAGGEEVGDRNFNGNRWPPEEAMALLKIRCDMDVAFRDATTPKVRLWEQVSRRLEELGHNRSAKKCKEKFENIYKYHRRTKEGRHGRTNGKTYRFFEQLESLQIPPSPEKNQGPVESTAKAPTTSNVIEDAMPCSIRFPSDPSSSATSSSSKEPGRENVRKKKRKMTEFFERLMKEVVEKQESLQKNFMEMLERCEQERIAREEAWKMQELARIKRERELLAQERSIAAAKDAAVLAFLKKFTEQAGDPVQLQLPEPIQVQNPIPNDKDTRPQENDNAGSVMITDKQESRKGGNFTHLSSSSSRWPKDEVEALIRLRTNFDVEYEGNGAKGPLWEEISSAMKKLGYDRSAKRCKEKWENMNKYFKRMKEKNKKKPEDSKTCPYYHQLDALYSSEKPKRVDEPVGSGKDQVKAEELLMHMMGGQSQSQSQSQSSSEDAEREKKDQNNNGGDGGNQ